MAKNNATGGIVKRGAVSGAVGKENKAIAGRSAGTTAREAQKAHRRSNQKAVNAIKAGGGGFKG